MQISFCGVCRIDRRETIARSIRYQAFAGALFFAIPAAAQSLPATADASPPIVLTASASYDSNVARSSAALAALRGIISEDEIYSPSAQLNIAKYFESTTAHLTASAGYDFYQHNAILNREDLNINAGASQQFFGCTAAVEGTYIRQQSDLDQLTIAVTKNTETISSAALGVTCDRGSRLSGSVSVAP